MKQMLSFLVVVSLLTTLSACSAKKPPEVAAIKSRNMLAVLRDLDHAYEKKDLSGFMAQVSPLYQNREAFSSSVAAVFSKYDDVTLNIQYPKMLILIEDKGQVRTTFNWDSVVRTSVGEALKNSGRVTLIFAPGDLKLLAVEGRNPFLPQQGETPGKP